MVISGFGKLAGEDAPLRVASRAFNRAEEDRIEADCDDIEPTEPDDAERLIAEARRFLALCAERFDFPPPS